MKSKHLLGAGLAALALGVSACSSSAHQGGQPASQVGAGGTHTSAAIAPMSPPAHVQASAFCDLAKHDSALVDSLGGDISKVDPGTYRHEVDDIIGAAPDAIKGDVQAFATVGIALNKGDTGAAAKLSSPQLLQHVRHFAGWMQANCPGVLDLPSSLPTS